MAGRIWGRRDCDFSRGSGPNACLTGSCTGTGLNCDKRTGNGVPAGRMGSTNLGPNCPSPLCGPIDKNGWVTGCKSACLANLTGDSTSSKNYCKRFLLLTFHMPL
ncbi:hypothetical protein FRC18_002169 [Serendipita sp. 400]|nr:hypothetical protein FRC18_002169 [Serendipita sp. 400]